MNDDIFTVFVQQALATRNMTKIYDFMIKGFYQHRYRYFPLIMHLAYIKENGSVKKLNMTEEIMSKRW